MRTDVHTESAQALVLGVIHAIGEDPKREGLVDTPSRVVKSWSTLFGGYKMDPKEILERRFSSEKYDQMIVLRDIEMYSTCEHHMLPFYGKAHIAYIPNGHVVGLSKLARLVECFARRMQIQEKLTQQIADAMVEHTGARGVGVMIEAQHMCMVARGVQKQNSVMVTSAIRGVFKDDPGVRDEFLRLGGHR
jgi:GTP cyclohydrolase I